MKKDEDYIRRHCNNIVFHCLLLLLVGCNANSKQLTDRWREPQEYSESVLAIPDSLLTDAQRRFIDTINLILMHGMDVRDDKLVFNVDTAIFERNNISLKYINILKENVAIQDRNLKSIIKETEEQGGKITYREIKESLDKAKEQLNSKSQQEPSL